MKWKISLLRRPLRKLSGRYRRFTESIVSVKIIAIVLVTVFIPSILITVLGFVAVRRAEPIFRRSVEAPIRSTLFELDRRLIKKWNSRRRMYARRLREERELQRYLASLVRTDDHVRDVILERGGEFRHIEPEPPFHRLELLRDDAALADATAAEIRDHDPARALDLYERILAAAPEPEVEVRALAGAARTLGALGRTAESAAVWSRIADRHGLAEDGAGIPWGLAALWRMTEVFHRGGDLVSAAKSARRLAARLNEWSPWLDEPVVRWFREHLEQYRRRSNDYALEIGLSEIRSPISRFALDPDNRRRLEEHARSLSGGGDSGYFSLPGDRLGAEPVSMAYFRLAPDTVVYFVLEPRAFLDDVRLFTGELQIPDSSLRFSASTTEAAPAASAGDDTDASTRPLERPFPRPFQDYRMYYLPAKDRAWQQLAHLETLESTAFIWTLVVLVLTILLGVMITVRSILEEIQVSKLKTDFVSFVSHELKTPLTAIRMFTEMLLDRRVESEEDERRCVELIDKEVSRLSRLIEQILEFSRIEKRQLTFRFSTCDMSEVVDEAVRIFRERNGDGEVEIVVNQAQTMSKIRMDRAAMVELLLNLLSNAYKYSRGRDRKIVINLKESIDDIFVEVTDFGVGIPRREQRRIFQRFYRAQDYLTRDIEGTGLGLTFARYIAEAHNGDIKVSSVPDQGSTFTLELRKNEVLAE